MAAFVAVDSKWLNWKAGGVGGRDADLAVAGSKTGGVTKPVSKLAVSSFGSILGALIGRSLTAEEPHRFLEESCGSLSTPSLEMVKSLRSWIRSGILEATCCCMSARRDMRCSGSRLLAATIASFAKAVILQVLERR